MKKIMAFLMVGIMLLTAVSISAGAFAKQKSVLSALSLQSGEKGSIFGKVTTFLDKPVSGATVYYGGGSVAGGDIEAALGKVTTDENGDYVILGKDDQGLPAGTYGLFVRKPGYTPNGAIIRLGPGENRRADFRIAKLSSNAQVAQAAQSLLLSR